MDVPIVFEDNDIVAVDKPSGLLVIPDRYRREIPNLRDMLAESYGGIFVVHRLDKETSGIVVFAKNAAAHRSLNNQFTGHTVKKTYLALVCGRLEHSSSSIKFSLEPDARNPSMVKVGHAGKISITDYFIREVFRDYTLVEAHPQTGRQHQIRVHFAALGHPLAFDRLYGSSEPILLSSLKQGYKPSGADEQPLLNRLSLHAEKISFLHPASNAPTTLVSPLPHDMEVLLRQLRKYNI